LNAKKKRRLAFAAALLTVGAALASVIVLPLWSVRVMTSGVPDLSASAAAVVSLTTRI